MVDYGRWSLKRSLHVIKVQCNPDPRIQDLLPCEIRILKSGSGIQVKESEIQSKESGIQSVEFRIQEYSL